MTTEVTRRSELAEFVSDHVFSYVNGNKLISVVDSDRLTNEVGEIILARDQVLMTAFLLPSA